MPSRFHFGILPHDACEIRSPCLVAFGRRSQPGPFLQEYQKHNVGLWPIFTPLSMLSSADPRPTLPAQVTALNGRLEVGDPRTRVVESFGEIRPASSLPLDAQHLPFAPVTPHNIPSTLSVPPPSPAEGYDFCLPSPIPSDHSSTQLSYPTSDARAADASVANFFLQDDSSSSEDDFSSEYSSEYLDCDDEDFMDDGDAGAVVPGPIHDPQLPLGDILIAADRRAVSYFAMPDFLPYVSFDAVSNALVADPPKYETHTTIPFNGIYCTSAIHTLNLTAALIISETSAHTTCEVGAEQAKFLAVCPPSIYYYNNPQYPERVVRGQTRLQNRYFEWRSFRRLHLDILMAVHASLTSEQSRDCNEADLCLIIIEDDKALPAWLTVPDEDIIYILLQELLLDDLFRTNIQPLANLGTIFATHKRKHQQEFAVFRPGPASAFEDFPQYEINGA
ncbi:hypothetical protein P692DRAFT_20821629 [Suillus brevipes Sb2]|nr:hypothetical protein P692DRAFT_20821629 [Suillus brevipes Sb2]